MLSQPSPRTNTFWRKRSVGLALLGNDAILKVVDAACWQILALSIDELIERNGGQFLSLITGLVMQIGYDGGALGLAEAGNLVAGLKRRLELSLHSVPGCLLSPEEVLFPLRRIYSEWKLVEPYDYRLAIS